MDDDARVPLLIKEENEDDADRTNTVIPKSEGTGVILQNEVDALIKEENEDDADRTNTVIPKNEGTGVILQNEVDADRSNENEDNADRSNENEDNVINLENEVNAEENSDVITTANAEDNSATAWPSIVESKQVWKIAFPVIWTQAIYTTIDWFNQYRLKGDASKAYSAFSSIIGHIVNGFLFGMVTGLETLCGQAYGAHQYPMLGIHLQTSWIIVLVTSTVLLTIYFSAPTILGYLGQDIKIVEEGGKLAMWFIPLMYSNGLSNCFLIFLEAQKKNWIMMPLTVLSLLIYFFIWWLLQTILDHFHLRFWILPTLLPTVVAYYVVNVGQFVCVVGGWCSNTWTGFTCLAFNDLCSVLSLSLKSVAMLCLEEWYDAIPLIVMGFFGGDDPDGRDVLMACTTITSYGMKISLGLLSAVSVRVSNALGEGNADAAKYSMLVTLVHSFFIGIMEAAVFIGFGDQLVHIIITDDNIANETAKLSVLLAIALFLNGFQSVLSGIAVGAGWQGYAAIVYLGNYAIAIIVGYCLMDFIAIKPKFPMIGMLIGTLFQIIVLAISMYRTNWDNEVTKTEERVQHSALVAQPTNITHIGNCFNAIWTCIRDTLVGGAEGSSSLEDRTTLEGSSDLEGSTTLEV